MKPSRQNRIIIHHISDLHFDKGLHSLISGYDTIPKDALSSRNRTDEYLRFLEKLNGNGPDVIVVSGDLTYYATEDEFKSAERFLRSVHKKAKGRLVVVPGNHDVDWSSIKPGEPLSPSRRNGFGKITKEYVTPFRREPYLQFKNVVIYALDSVALSGLYFEDDKLKMVQAMIKEKVKAGGPSSADEVERLKELLRAFRVDPSIITWEQLDTLQSHVRKLDRSLASKRGLIKIAVLHHHITGFGEAEVRAFDTPVNAGFIKHKLADAGFQIILHGHKHAFNAVLEKDLSNGLDLFILGAGTLSSDGPTKGFSEIQIELSTGDVRVEPFEWDKYEFKTIGKPISLNLNSRLAIKGVSETSLRFFERLHEIILGMEKSRVLSKQDFNDVLRFLEARGYGVAGLDEEFLDEMNSQLEDRNFNRLFFTDILGPHSWSHPDFSVHMAQQIRHYIEMNFRKVEKESGEEEWAWVTKFGSALNHAIRRAFLNARSNLGQTEVSQFDWLANVSTADNPPDPSRFEIARILFWKEQDLLTTPAKVLVKLHKYMRMPLFYINPSEFRAHPESKRLGDVLNYEYHVFVRPNDTCKGKFYRRIPGGFTRTRQPIDGRVPGNIGNPVTHFYSLLEYDKLYLADDYQTYLEDKRRRTGGLI